MCAMVEFTYQSNFPAWSSYNPLTVNTNEDSKTINISLENIFLFKA